MAHTRWRVPQGHWRRRTHMDLEKQFTRGLLDGCQVLAKEHRYNPTYFRRMVLEHGGVEAVRRLLRSENYQEGLHTLWELGRLDASVEAAILNPKYAAL